MKYLIKGILIFIPPWPGMEINTSYCNLAIKTLCHVRSRNLRMCLHSGINAGWRKGNTRRGEAICRDSGWLTQSWTRVGRINFDFRDDKVYQKLSFIIGFEHRASSDSDLAWAPSVSAHSHTVSTLPRTHSKFLYEALGWNSGSICPLWNVSTHISPRS